MSVTMMEKRTMLQFSRLDLLHLLKVNKEDSFRLLMTATQLETFLPSSSFVLENEKYRERNIDFELVDVIKKHSSHGGSHVALVHNKHLFF